MKLEKAIESFLIESRRLQSKSPLKVIDLFNAASRNYKKTRIKEAPLENNADVLIFECGTEQSIITDLPVDLRNADDEVEHEDDRRLYVKISRQLALDEEEYDDGVQFVTTLYFSKEQSKVASERVPLHHPDELESAIDEFKEISLVTELMDHAGVRLVATVEYLG